MTWKLPLPCSSAKASGEATGLPNGKFTQHRSPVILLLLRQLPRLRLPLLLRSRRRQGLPHSLCYFLHRDGDGQLWWRCSENYDDGDDVDDDDDDDDDNDDDGDDEGSDRRR